MTKKTILILITLILLISTSIAITTIPPTQTTKENPQPIYIDHTTISSQNPNHQIITLKDDTKVAILKEGDN